MFSDNFNKDALKNNNPTFEVEIKLYPFQSKQNALRLMKVHLINQRNISDEAILYKLQNNKWINYGVELYSLSLLITTIENLLFDKPLNLLNLVKILQITKNKLEASKDTSHKEIYYFNLRKLILLFEKDKQTTFYESLKDFYKSQIKLLNDQFRKIKDYFIN